MAFGGIWIPVITQLASSAQTLRSTTPVRIAHGRPVYGFARERAFSKG